MLTPARTQRGFGLVELMIALVLGIVVSGAVLAFVATIVQTSGETVQATRLDQELRSLTEVVSREIRRARAVSDPLADIGSGCTDCATDDFETIDTATPGCIKFAYATPNGPATPEAFRTISLDAGAVRLAQGTTTQDCSTGVVLNTPLVTITGMEFTETIEDTLIALTVTGQLANDASVSSTYTTNVAIRSGAP